MQPVVRTVRYTPDAPLSVAQLSRPALPLQKLLFSATVTHDPSKLAPLQLYKPRLYSCGGKYTLPSSLQVSWIGVLFCHHFIVLLLHHFIVFFEEFT
jgi:ATP-dependent RNA helicase DDX51/DBP6